MQIMALNKQWPLNFLLKTNCLLHSLQRHVLRLPREGSAVLKRGEKSLFLSIQDLCAPHPPSPLCRMTWSFKDGIRSHSLRRCPLCSRVRSQMLRSVLYDNAVDFQRESLSEKGEAFVEPLLEISKGPRKIAPSTLLFFTGWISFRPLSISCRTLTGRHEANGAFLTTADEKGHCP